MASSSRRDFLKQAATVGAAAGVGVAGGLGLASARSIPVAHPFSYPGAGLDVERTWRLCHEGFRGVKLADGKLHKGCAFSTFNAIIGQLAEVVGAPYTMIPTQMMEWGAEGVVGFGSLCGALTGSAAAIGLIRSQDDAKATISDLMSWYSETPLPTNLPALASDLPQSTAESNLCHVSRGRWCRISGFAVESDEREERCARVSADVAAKAVQLLNDRAEGLPAPSRKNDCLACHEVGVGTAGDPFHHGKMNCRTCHSGPFGPDSAGGK